MFRRKRSADDFAAEIQAHLQLEADELEQEGSTPDEARRRARVEFGNRQAAQERYYLKERVPWLDNLARDITFALRQCVRNPGFAAAVILVLALGIGASLAIFSFVDAALLEPLPYANPARLMSVNESSAEQPRWPLSYPDFVDWQRLNKSFSSLAVYSGTSYLLRTSTGAEPAQAERISGDFFITLGVRPMLGRDFYPGENRPDGPNVALLSYSAWLHRFAGKRDAVGRVVDLDNIAYTVIGVLPRSFTFAPGDNAEFWVPLNRFSEHEKTRAFYNFWGVGRLRDNVSPPTAQAEMTAIAKQLQQQYGIHGFDLSAGVVPLSDVFVGDIRPVLLTLFSGSLLLLAIACINVANLVLVRSEARRHEIAIRGALGATRARLTRQFVTEGLLYSSCGGVAGLAIAAGLIRLLARLVPKDMAANMPFLAGAGLNSHTLAFAITMAAAVSLLLAATPALQLSSHELRSGLADGGRGAGSHLWRRVGANLVIAELAVAVVLLAGAGLMGKSLHRLLHVSLGFDPDRLATLHVAAPGATYRTAEEFRALSQEITRRISTVPGVTAVGKTSMLPVQCDCSTDRIHFPEKPDNGEHNEVDERHISPGYLPALKAVLVRGRFFTDADDASHPNVAVINQSLAQKYFPGEDPVGRRIADDESGQPTVWEIVGVIRDIREGPLDAPASPAEYFPLQQTGDRGFTLIARTTQDAATLLPSLVSALHRIDAELGVSDEATVAAKIDATQAALLHRFSAWLTGGFAAIALLLSVIGLYGVVAYSVSRRTREIGVRMALGARRSSVYKLILRQVAWLAATGLGIGLIASLGSSMLLRKLLFGVQAWDAATLLGVIVVLVLASLAAGFLPARRAASVNPTDALRAE